MAMKRLPSDWMILMNSRVECKYLYLNPRVDQPNCLVAVTETCQLKDPARKKLLWETHISLLKGPSIGKPK